MKMQTALFYEKSKTDIICLLCPHNCRIKEGDTGFCRIRKNENGTLVLPYYGQISSSALDPIEKKPFYRFHFGSKILSIGGYSCNMRCAWCQNHSISMNVPAMSYVSPSDLLEMCAKYVPHGNIGVAYTYNEPLIHYEYVMDCAKIIAKSGYKNALVTNGMINIEPLMLLLPFISAMNIDLKGNKSLYKNASGDYETVKQTIEIASASCHVEVTTLIIPGLNDTEEVINEISAFLADINPKIPLHLTRFYPRYKMIENPAAERENILKLKDVATRRLRYVYG